MSAPVSLISDLAFSSWESSWILLEPVVLAALALSRAAEAAAAAAAEASRAARSRWAAAPRSAASSACRAVLESVSALGL